jgi:hypothetical protein
MTKPPLSETHPEIAAEADGWDPSSITHGHDKKKPWKCKDGHTWEAAPFSRTGKNKRGCPVCAGKAVQDGYNDLATTNPEIAKEAEDWNPKEFSAGSKKKMNWKCSNGHIYEAAIQSRASVGTGCPVCAGKLVVTGFNDLKSLFPDIAMQADGWDPEKVTPGAKKKLPWKCSLGHSWDALLSDRTGKHKSGCPICSNQKLSSGHNDLLSLYPAISKEAYGWDPSIEIAGGKKIREWKCENNHIYKASVYQRVSSRKQGCPYCTNFKVLSGFNDMNTTHPHLAAELVGEDPSKIIAGTAIKLTWKCPLGHIYGASGTSRASTKQSGCPVCDGKQVLAGFNDLKSKYPEIASEADGWDPATVSVGSSKKYQWKCREGHTWSTTPNSRVGQNAGCPSCAKFGYDPNLDGYFYFLIHHEWEIYQIGITNYPKERIKKHSKLGWKVIEIRGPMDGHLTRDWETDCLRYLRNIGVHLGPQDIAGKFDGFSETWRIGEFSVASISELMNQVRDVEFRN